MEPRCLKPREKAYRVPDRRLQLLVVEGGVKVEIGIGTLQSDPLCPDL